MKLKMRFLFVLIVVSRPSFCQENETYSERVYTPYIKTVRMQEAGHSRQLASQGMAIELQQQPGLILEFDDLSGESPRYAARLVHCSYLWHQSSLHNLDFIDVYNEFNLIQYQLSLNTRVPYTHYQFEIPRVKLPGNYALVVYKDHDANDVVLVRRFIVYQNATQLISAEPDGTLALYTDRQPLRFSIRYQGFGIENPYEWLHLVIRQNQRWDNAQFDRAPSVIREEASAVEYEQLGEVGYFMAGNEFRVVDFRSTRSPGEHTDRIDMYDTPIHLWVQTDRSKAYTAYARYADMNGGFYIENLDDIEDDISSEYLNVVFRLKAEEMPTSKVYLVGALNDWRKDAASQMRYNAASGEYTLTLLLKQGRYNYQYAVTSDHEPEYLLEGSHSETENRYEALLYYWSPKLRADLVIGYFTIPINASR